MIRVVLVDDHELVRTGIASLLSLAPQVEVVGQAADGPMGLDLIRAADPDVVLLDVRMPRIDGLGVLRSLVREGRGTAVVILTTFDDDRVLRQALAGGARGYLLKDATLDQLVEAIETAAAGGTFVQPGSRERLADGLDRLGDPTYESRPVDDLTDREIEVLRLVARGFGNAEIAATLGVVQGTVKNHVSSVLSKLGVRDRTRAALTALDRGLI